ncbi:MAG: RelA/SpoT family protein [bacterium]|nr:RelA/SpoT family protein [bacterium]
MEKGELIKLANKFYTEEEVARLEAAVDFASEKHEGQLRKSGEPYITHPLKVAGILIEWGMDADTIIAGVLHDVVEDTETPLDEIEATFGEDIAFLVDGVTKVGKARSGMNNLETYLPQTKDNLSKLLIAVGQDVRVVIIKLADRLHNVQTLEHMSPEKQKKIARETLDVFARIADRLGMGRVRMTMEETAFSYLNPSEYKRLSNEIRKRLGKSTRKLGRVREEVESELKKAGIDFEISGRVKSVYSLHKKLKKTKGDIDRVYDLMALRIIVKNKDDCYRVLGILHSIYKPMIERIKDYISMPKPNGYQSLHTTVITPSKLIAEFQIRTEEMHEFAERGLAASFHYHEQKSSGAYLSGATSRERIPQAGRPETKGNGGLSNELQWIVQLQDVAQRLRDGEEIDPEQLQIDIFGDRIFVYSPKGDIYNLPEGALPLDFAYMVHSDVGKHAYAFRVNEKIHAFDKPLEEGDVVEVITRKTSLPKVDWLDLVKTSHARVKLRAQLRNAGLLGRISNTAAAQAQRLRDKFGK